MADPKPRLRAGARVVVPCQGKKDIIMREAVVTDVRGETNIINALLLMQGDEHDRLESHRESLSYDEKKQLGTWHWPGA